MSSGSPKRRRFRLALPPGQWARTLANLRREDVLMRIGLCLGAAILMWLSTCGWIPPFAYRIGDVPPRNIVARTEFGVEDKAGTQARKDQKRAETICVYQHDVQPLMTLQQKLKDQVFQVIRAESYERLDQAIWENFLTDEERKNPRTAEPTFVEFRQAFSEDPDLTLFEQVLQRSFEGFVRNGLLKDLDPVGHFGNRLEIDVHKVGSEAVVRVEVKDIRIAVAAETLRRRLAKEFDGVMVADDRAKIVTDHILAWLDQEKLPVTLTLNPDATDKAYRRGLAQVEEAIVTYRPGDKLVDGATRLTAEDIQVLRQEYRQLTANMSFGQRLGHFAADFGMYVAVYVLCGFFIYYREPRLLVDLRRFATMLALVVVAVAFCSLASQDKWRAEIIPLLMFGMTVTIAYRQELALLLSSSVSLLVVLSLGQGLVEFVIYVATVAAAIQLLDRVRSRTKLIYVGLCAGVVGAFTTLGVSTVASQVYGARWVSVSTVATSATLWETSVWALLENATWCGTCAVLAGVFMTGLLPFIERVFDVQTDISLLELGDAAHPLLQELVRRAPGTYNHSINVASIAEAAADAIGGNGLLTRVGAYFHDIGKMLKPSYFVENQTEGANRHESLVPAMSTLVIIAHVKDGADLARQHRLPRSIMDFIEQHHGTTLVEYFYDRAAKQIEADPDGSEIDETSFRYPGPKPQTKEAAVMMVADAAEGASRALVEPTPARIEGLVQEIALKRLLDGQFDECGLTLRELHVIEESLVKSLTAVYHGRVKYPEKQFTA